MSATPPESAPDEPEVNPPFNPDDETLPSSPHSARTQADVKFRSKERDLSGAQLGEYRLTRKIAEGGMGEVYEAVQLKLDRRVAVKLLSEQLSREEEFLARFEREAKSAAALNHPNIVQVYDYGCADGQYYFVMELMDGMDLSAYVKEHGKLPIPEALGVFEQAVQALRFAARHAIIHRDVKPANLMLTSDGQVKVADLGLAKKLTDDSDVTMTGVGMGSPHFLAPEQADDAAHVDHRADIYSLGVTLLFLLTGKRPYEGASNFSVVLAHANKPLPTGVELGTPLPEEIERFIKRMTAKLPAGRYQSYDELLADLQRVKAGHGPRINLGQVLKDARTIQYAAISLVAILVLAIGVPMLLPDRKPAEKVKAPATAPVTPVPVAAATPPATSIAKNDPGPPPGERPPQGERPPRNDDPPPPPGDRMEKGKGPKGGKAGPGAKGGPAGRLRLPWPQKPPPDHNPIKDGPIPVMLAEADKFAAANKDELTRIIDHYRQVERKAEGTPHEEQTRRKTDAAIDNHINASKQLIAKLQAQMEAHLQERKVQDAYSVWRQFPQAWRTYETDQEILQILDKFMPPNFQPQ